MSVGTATILFGILVFCQIYYILSRNLWGRRIYSDHIMLSIFKTNPDEFNYSPELNEMIDRYNEKIKRLDEIDYNYFDNSYYDEFLSPVKRYYRPSDWKAALLNKWGYSDEYKKLKNELERIGGEIELYRKLSDVDQSKSRVTSNSYRGRNSFYNLN